MLERAIAYVHLRVGTLDMNVVFMYSLGSVNTTSATVDFQCVNFTQQAE